MQAIPVEEGNKYTNLTVHVLKICIFESIFYKSISSRRAKWNYLI